MDTFGFMMIANCVHNELYKLGNCVHKELYELEILNLEQPFKTACGKGGAFSFGAPF